MRSWGEGCGEGVKAPRVEGESDVAGFKWGGESAAEAEAEAGAGAMAERAGAGFGCWSWVGVLE